MSRPEAGNGVAGIDVGGTFTDLVFWDGEQLRVGKVPSTPDDQSRGVIDALTEFDPPPAAIVHGTTVATNALLERRGARTALVTTEGFEDVLAIGRQDRPALYDTMADRPEPLAPLRVGVARDSAVPQSVDLGDPESVAVSLLYGYEQPEAEAALGRLVAAAYPNVPVSLSSVVVPEFREFERTSTTVLNAYLRPEMARYLERLDDRLRSVGAAGHVAVMRSSGGLMSLAEAAALPAAALLSGPAGGVVAAAQLSAAMGYDRAISFDMGGTSTDVSRIEGGRPAMGYERPIAAYPCRLAAIDIHTVGAGGGSIAWIDPGGSLRVGPQSAGAVPGPACYGRGGVEPTVTDANVALGRIARLAGSGGLDDAAAQRAVAGLAAALGLDETAAALGIVTVVEEAMAGAIRRVSVEEGVDPRGAALVAFGGAGGLHAGALARRLDMRAVVVPRFAGVFSALGLLLSPPRVDVAQSIRGDSEVVGAAEELKRAATRGLHRATGTGGDVNLRLDMRYRGQAHEISVDCDFGEPLPDVKARFHDLHFERNGFARRDDPVEVVTVRVAAVGSAALQWRDLPAPPPPMTAHEPSSREVISRDGEVVVCRVVSAASLSSGDDLAGPAIVEDNGSTTFVDDDEHVTVDTSGALVVEW